MRRTKLNLAKDERGNVAFISALALIPIISVVGLTIDFRITDNHKAMAQSVIDGAVLAGGRHLMNGKTREAAIAETNEYLADLIGLDAGGLHCQVQSVTSPPTEFSVYAQAQCSQDTTISAALGRESVNFAVRAKARFRTTQSGCVLAVGPSAGYGISAWGSSSINANNCALISNVTNANSVQVGGSGQITAACVYAAGGIQGSAITTTDCSEPVPYDDPVVDPYSNLTVPSVASLPCTTISTVSGRNKMTPGRYCGRIDLNRPTDLAPGTYYIDGQNANRGGINTSGGSVTLQGTDVTLIFMNNAKLDNTNTGLIDIKAPTTGDYKGIAVMADPATTTAGTTWKINGNANTKIQGVVYAPNVKLEYTGGANNSDGCTQIVAGAVEFIGNSKVYSNCGGAGTKEFGPNKPLYLEM